MVRGLNDRVLLRVKSSAQLVAFTTGHAEAVAQATDIVGVSGALGRPVVPGGEDVSFFDDDGADLPSQTA